MFKFISLTIRATLNVLQETISIGYQIKGEGLLFSLSFIFSLAFKDMKQSLRMSYNKHILIQRHSI